MKNIYLDNAATTKVHESVLKEMLPYFSDNFGNASSIYELGQKNKSVIENVREKIKKILDIKNGEIYFTSGGTEADNWALIGIAEAYRNKGNHIITTKIEHHAVLHTCQYLEKNGFEVTYLNVDSNGLINFDELRKSIKDSTILISVIYANNEIGTVQDIKKIGDIARENNIVFHTDAVQALGHLEINFDDVDLLSMSSHKIYGSKGIGALYVRKGIKLNNLIYGGGQENKKRPGTENVPGIVGFGKAIERAVNNMKAEMKRQQELRDYVIIEILTKIPHTILNGHPKKRLSNNINISFRFIEGESLILMLSLKGISVSSGSACTSGSLDPSHVLLSIGLDHETAHGSLRITLGEETTKEDLDVFIYELIKIVKELRDMSPLYEDFAKEVV